MKDSPVMRQHIECEKFEQFRFTSHYKLENEKFKKRTLICLRIKLQKRLFGYVLMWLAISNFFLPNRSSKSVCIQIALAVDEAEYMINSKLTKFPLYRCKTPFTVSSANCSTSVCFCYNVLQFL